MDEYSDTDIRGQLKPGIPGSVQGLSLVEGGSGNKAGVGFMDVNVGEFFTFLWYSLTNRQKPFCENVDATGSLQEQIYQAEGGADCLIPLKENKYQVDEELSLRGRGLKASGVFGSSRLVSLGKVFRLQKAVVNPVSGEILGDGKDILLSELGQASMVMVEFQGDVLSKSCWLHDAGEINGVVILPVKGVSIKSSAPNMLQLENTLIVVNEGELYEELGFSRRENLKNEMSDDREAYIKGGSLPLDEPVDGCGSGKKGKTTSSDTGGGSGSTMSQTQPGAGQTLTSGTPGDGGKDDPDKPGKKLPNTHENDVPPIERAKSKFILTDLRTWSRSLRSSSRSGDKASKNTKQQGKTSESIEEKAPSDERHPTESEKPKPATQAGTEANGQVSGATAAIEDAGNGATLSVLQTQINGLQSQVIRGREMHNELSGRVDGLEQRVDELGKSVNQHEIDLEAVRTEQRRFGQVLGGASFQIWSTSEIEKRNWERENDRQEIQNLKQKCDRLECEVDFLTSQNEGLVKSNRQSEERLEEEKQLAEQKAAQPPEPVQDQEVNEPEQTLAVESGHGSPTQEEGDKSQTDDTGGVKPKTPPKKPDVSEV